ncbi:MAG: glycosyltransferase family 2 protein [Candidatus Omnitrophota bacterium]
MLLSVIMPVYNEAKTIKQVIDKVLAVPVEKEIIVVDDSSTDGTGKILRDLRYDNLKVIHHSSNRGKGAAVLTGIEHVSGEYVIVQDADFEYDPLDYLKLLEAIKTGAVDLVLGARFTSGYHGMKIPKVGNRLLTGLMNILFGVRLNDCFTCYKLMRKTDLLSLGLGSNSFDIEIEILAKAIKKRMRIAEVPVSYSPRTYHEGKKIRIKDGIWAVLRIFKFRIS